MRKLLVGCAVMALCGLSWALDDDIEGWVKDLGAEDPKVRAAASQGLEKAGERAREALEAAAKSGDPEVAAEARYLLRRLDGTEERPAAKKPQPGRRPMVRMSSMRVIVGRDGTTASVQEDSAGNVIVKETKDGKTESWAAGSKEEFVEKYPEVAKKYGIEAEQGGPRVAPGKGSPEEDELRESLEDLRRQAEERLRERQREAEELKKALEERDRREREEEQGPGLEVGDVDEVLRYQMDLPEGGVLVTGVAKGSRAERIGIRRHDILVALNGKPVSSPADVRAALQAEGPATAEVIRKGEHQTLREQE